MVTFVRAKLVSIFSIATIALLVSGCIAPSDLQAYASEDHEETDDWEEAECEDEEVEDADEDADAHAHAHDHDEIDPEEAFTDASPRFANVVDGREESTRTISVPFGTDSLRVALVHDSDARVEFQVRDPLYRTLAEEEARGEKYTYEEEWLIVHDPLPGEWKIDIDIRGESSYTIGSYLDA